MATLVRDLGATAQALGDDDSEEPLCELESLCMRCGENGTTRVLLTRIPHFREVVLMAFECPHCNERNNEVQFAGQLYPQGCQFTLKVPSGDAKVLDRQIVKSDSATIKVPELDFEVPPEAQAGTLSTIEGVLRRAAEGLQALQPERWKVDPKTSEAIDVFLSKLKACAEGEKAFTLVLDDPSGNSFIQNPHAPGQDPLVTSLYYDRTSEQQAALGFVAETLSTPIDDVPTVSNARCSDAIESTGEEVNERHKYVPAGTQRLPHGSVGAQIAHRAIAKGNSADVAAALFKYSTPEEVMMFPATCGACGAACDTRMFVTNIPYFKEVIVMASTCDVCGYRSSEVKPGGGVPEKGRKITVRITNKQDLSRDVIKSDTTKVVVPELELELVPGTLGGLVTTVEGLLAAVGEKLHQVHGFSTGDTADKWKRQSWQDFDDHLQRLLKVEEPWTLELDDALANSFIAPATDSFEDDKQLTSEEYVRTWEQDEELGLNDMDTADADTAYSA